MYACGECGCTGGDSTVCDNCGCTELVELGLCENCLGYSDIGEFDEFGLCGGDGNNCQEDDEVLEDFEDRYIGFILDASEKLLK